MAQIKKEPAPSANGTSTNEIIPNLSKANAAIKNEKHIWRAMDNIIFNKNKAAGGTANEV